MKLFPDMFVVFCWCFGGIPVFYDACVTGLWVGVLLLALAACWLPLLLFADFQGSQNFRLVVTATAAAGIAFAFIQPPFPFQVIALLFGLHAELQWHSAGLPCCGLSRCISHLEGGKRCRIVVLQLDRVLMMCA